MIIKEISQHSENVVASPYGLMSNLAMIFEATNDKTREEFLKTLNISGNDVSGLRKGFKAYCSLFLVKINLFFLSQCPKLIACTRINYSFVFKFMFNLLTEIFK